MAEVDEGRASGLNQVELQPSARKTASSTMSSTMPTWVAISACMHIPVCACGYESELVLVLALAKRQEECKMGS